MAERASMTELVNLVERLVNDPENVAHSKDDIQAALDVYRVEARYDLLTGVPTRTAEGVVWQTFQADAGYWETDAILYSGNTRRWRRRRATGWQAAGRLRLNRSGR